MAETAQETVDGVVSGIGVFKVTKPQGQSIILDRVVPHPPQVNLQYYMIV